MKIRATSALKDICVRRSSLLYSIVQERSTLDVRSVEIAEAFSDRGVHPIGRLLCGSAFIHPIGGCSIIVALEDRVRGHKILQLGTAMVILR